MKSGIRLINRKIRSHIPQLLGLILLLTIGVCFFITPMTIALRYEETAEQFLSDYVYADVTLYGSFNDEYVESISENSGIRSVQGRTVRDVRYGERIIRVVSLTEGINNLHIYDGRIPSNETECIILKRNAEAMGFSIGDNLTLSGQTLTITGLAASPEYIYMVHNERSPMAQPGSFGVVYVTQGFFQEGYNEIVMLTDDAFISNSLETDDTIRRIVQKEQPNHALYRADMDQLTSFSYIFPFVFAALIAVVIYVMLKRSIQKDRKQIGTMKALGVTDRKIIGIYLSQYCICALLGALIGCLTASLVCDMIIDVLSSMFEVPTLSFVLYPGLWSVAVLVSVLLCAISGLIALFSILPLLPAHAMRPRMPKSGRRIFLERFGFLWKRISFNTRYALKNSLRNKGRFFAVMLGMCGSCALLIFSLGFYNSMSDTQDKFFQDFADYDVIVSFDLTPLPLSHPALARIDESQKALTLPVRIWDENHIITIVEEGFDMVIIPGAALQKGVIVPEYYAQQWGVEVGDMLEISGYSAIVSAIVPQYLGLSFYTGFDYIGTITDEIPDVYNTIFGRSGNMAELRTYLMTNDFDYTTIDDDRTSFDSIMESITVLIWFMITCSIMLGITVLYSVGLINLSAREFEYMFMGVMGYPHKSIMMAHIKESAIQLVLAIPLGFLLGNFILNSIKGEFSGNGFVVSAAVYPLSYLASALSVIVVTAIISLVTSRHIGRLDIVEGLKAQDD